MLPRQHLKMLSTMHGSRENTLFDWLSAAAGCWIRNVSSGKCSASLLGASSSSEDRPEAISSGKSKGELLLWLACLSFEYANMAEASCVCPSCLQLTVLCSVDEQTGQW